MNTRTRCFLEAFEGKISPPGARIQMCFVPLVLRMLVTVANFCRASYLKIISASEAGRISSRSSPIGCKKGEAVQKKRA